MGLKARVQVEACQPEKAEAEAEEVEEAEVEAEEEAEEEVLPNLIHKTNNGTLQIHLETEGQCQ